MSPDPRALRLVALCLQGRDGEVLLQRLLTASLFGPRGFANLLPHLPADPARARLALVNEGSATAAELQAATEALDAAAQALEEGHPPPAEGLAGLRTWADRLMTTHEPFYRHVGERLAELLVVPVTGAPRLEADNRGHA